MNLIKPKNLKYGDTIAIIAPSGDVESKKIENAKHYFENRGFNIKFGKHIFKKFDYLAGNDIDRLEDLHWAFSDKSIDAIICARGGYGAIRLLNKIDYDLISQNPKIFCGYSDITALNAIILKKTGLITFSGPMAQCDFGNNIDKFTENSFFNTVTNLSFNISAYNPVIYNKGNAQGLIFGGNLTTIASICGLDFIPDDKFIFFAEDIGESAYKIDRYFTQLFNIEKFRNNISAIILGDFSNIDNQNYLDTYFKTLADNNKNIPIIAGFPIGHEIKKATVMYGAMTKLENNSIISVL
ncbi:LD-carboxypeptidase [bacterium]|nr:LD-carboxypeptidase [bacterium]